MECSGKQEIKTKGTAIPNIGLAMVLIKEITVNVLVGSPQVTTKS